MERRILSILASVRPEIDFGASADFLADGLIDSLDVVMITVALETEFGVSIPGEWVLPEHYASAARLAALVRRCGAAAA